MNITRRIESMRRTLQGLLLLITFVDVLSQSTFSKECQNYSPAAVIKGNKIFVSSTGQYLPIKGINYYPRPNEGDLVLGNSQDFYTEAFRASWERDIEQFVALGLNAIRLYAVDPGQNHDAFMCALKAAGIYVLVGLAADCQNCAIQWQDPPLCYPQTLKDRGEFIIAEFARYENVLGFSAGNEVALSAANYLGNLPCQKKFLRDMRAFVKECVASGDMRHIPVGLEFADHEREVNAKYFNCRTDPEDELENAEFLGINAYLHCDGTATDIDQLIGYKTLLAGVASWGMTVPLMWTEFGCLNPSFEQLGEYEAQRNFLQVDALFSPEYREHFNGGFVFEYSTEKVYSQSTSPYPFTSFGYGNYGVGYFSPEDCDGIDIPCEYNPFPQFQSLAARYAAVDTSDEPTLDNYNPPVRDPPTCPDEIPSLSAFDWATEFDVASTTRTRQCPVLVPVYCVGVPAECVTISNPGAEDTILVATPFPTTFAPATPTQGPSFSNASEPISIGASSVITPSNTSSSESAIAGSPVESTTDTPTATMSSESSFTTSPSPTSSLRTSGSPTETRTSAAPTESSTVEPSDGASQSPSNAPSPQPSEQHTLTPTSLPTTAQSVTPSPTQAVSFSPTSAPSDFRQISIDMTDDKNRATSSAVRLWMGRFGSIVCTILFAIAYIQH